jgi:Zn-dependent protease/predicted transcriptional regulator
MQTNWRIGSLFGIPLFIDPLWFVILALTILNFGFSYSQWGTVLGWSAGILMALLLFVSVLLHELGHSLAAQSQGIKVNSITLFLFGGIASIEEESKTPFQAFQVAIAGPLVSIFLFLICWTISNFLSDATPGRMMLGDLARINFVLALFNLIPGLPLDGGQVLKAALWKITGNRFQAVRLAARAGQILGYVAIALGLLVDYLTGELISGLWIAFLGWFAIRNATSYIRVTNLQETLMAMKASDVMTRDYRVVEANQSLRDFADFYLLQNQNSTSQTYFAVSDGRYQGMIFVDNLRIMERSLWETQTLDSIIRPLTEIPFVSESTSLVDVIIKIEDEGLNLLTILSPAGAVAGVLDKGDIVKALAEKLNLQINDGDIKNIKESRQYPSGLQLAALAKSTKN